MRELSKAAVRSLGRFPYTYLCGLLAAVFFYVNWKMNGSDEITLIEAVLATALFGIPLSLGVVIATEAKPWPALKKSLIQTALVLLPCLAIFAHLSSGDEWSVMWTYGSCMVLAHLVLTYAVSFRRDWDGNSYWFFNYLLFRKFSYATIVAGLWYVGVLFICIAIRLLFKLDHKFFSECSTVSFALAAFIMHPLVFCSAFPADFFNIGEEPHPRPLRLIAQYVLLPLLCAYSAVLYVYLISSFLSGNIPKGMIAAMTASGSLVGLVTLLSLLPLEKSAEFSWVKKANQLFYAAVIPLLLVSLWSLSIRIKSYGWTEPRTMLVIYSLWLLVIALLGILKKSTFRTIHISVFAIVLVTAMGPLSVSSISLRSQKAQLKTLLARLNVLDADQKIIPGPTKSLSYQDVQRSESIVTYIIQMHSWKSLRDLIPTTAHAQLEEAQDLGLSHYWDRSQHVIKWMGLQYVPKEFHPSRFLWQARQQEWVLDGLHYANQTVEVDKEYVLEGPNLSLKIEGTRVIVRDGGGTKTTYFELADYIKHAPETDKPLKLKSQDQRQQLVIHSFTNNGKTLSIVEGLWILRPF